MTSPRRSNARVSDLLVSVAPSNVNLFRTNFGRLFASLLAFSFLAAGVYFSALFLTGNIHAVVPGEVYRSAQLSATQIERYVRLYKIASIINLRGENLDRPWYVSEVDISGKLQVQHFDFRMSAKRRLTQENAAKLIALMVSAPKPVMIHCGSGSDRTGLAAALYLAAVKKVGETTAEEQMQIGFGHVALPFLPAYAIYESWESLETWLGYRES